MARIAGVSDRQAGPLLKLAHRFVRREVRRPGGRQPESMIEPVEPNCGGISTMVSSRNSRT